MLCIEFAHAMYLRVIVDVECSRSGGIATHMLILMLLEGVFSQVLVFSLDGSYSENTEKTKKRRI